MNWQALLVTVMLLVCAGTACNKPSSGEGAVLLRGEEAIVSSSESCAAAFLDGDIEAWAAFYGESAVLMAPDRPVIEGRKDIKAWRENLPAVVDYSLMRIALEVHDDLAFVRGTYSVKTAASGTDQSTRDNGKYVRIWRRQKGGAWLIEVDIFNSDLPSTR